MHNIRRIKSSDGAHSLALYTWEPEGEPKGVMQIIHGMREYMSRYGDFAAYMNAHGFTVCGHDHLGHGETARPANDYGYFGPDRGGGYLLADCKRVSRLIRREYPDLPLFLLGHSMGSLLGRLYIMRPPVRLSGFICMGTGGERAAAAGARAVFELVARIRGDKAASPFLNRAVISLRGAFGKEDGGWLCRDNGVAEKYGGDPHIAPLFTNRGVCDLLTLQMAATSAAWAAKVDTGLPILLLSGDDDVIGGKGGRGVVQTYERLQAAGCPDVRCKLYEGSRHELLNELNKEEVYYDILSWISEKM